MILCSQLQNYRAKGYKHNRRKDDSRLVPQRLHLETITQTLEHELSLVNNLL